MSVPVNKIPTLTYQQRHLEIRPRLQKATEGYIESWLSASMLLKESVNAFWTTTRKRIAS